MRISKQRRRSMHTMPEISLTPLIDVALTLLVIFMITAPMMYNAIKIELPSGRAKEDADGNREEVIVSIDDKGTLFLNGVPYAKDVLIAQLKIAVGALGGSQDRIVHVHGDRAASYGSVLELVDQIKVVGGIKYVALATKKMA
jgi:biopolymer transport protein TolR